MVAFNIHASTFRPRSATTTGDSRTITKAKMRRVVELDIFNPNNGVLLIVRHHNWVVIVGSDEMVSEGFFGSVLLCFLELSVSLVGT